MFVWRKKCVLVYNLIKDEARNTGKGRGFLLIYLRKDR